MYTMYTSVLIVLLKACSHNLICAHFQLPLDAIYSALNCYMCNMMKRWIRWGGGGGGGLLLLASLAHTLNCRKVRCHGSVTTFTQLFDKRQ